MNAHFWLNIRAADENTLIQNTFSKSKLFNDGFYGQDIGMAFSPPEHCRLLAQDRGSAGILDISSHCSLTVVAFFFLKGQFLF